MKQVDYLVIGGGFYGCALAAFLRSVSDRVMLVEAAPELLTRASRVNQARVHTGFHYPRSALTAVKSMVLHQRFAADFPDAVVDDFTMLYAVAQHRTKVSAKRFHRMFHDMGAPIEPASPSQAALFNPAFVDQAFACREYAFDYSVLRRQLAGRLDALDVDLRLSTTVESIAETGSAAVARLSDGTEIAAGTIFNVTYSQINHLLGTAGLAPVGLKHELAEIALVEVPPELARYGITVIDGPFMSCMPYPAAGLHSLTHVRFTPHASWTDQGAGQSAHRHMESLDPVSHHRHMLLDSQRYIPALAGARWDRSLFEVKTVLTKNEKDDGRPILFHRQPADSRIVSVMGGKIDNIYDLFDLMRRARPEWAGADPSFVSGPLPQGRARMTVPAALVDARLLRFGIVIVIGLGIDLALGWTLAARAGLPLWLAATIGFVTAACVNYVLHERWTFAGGRLSAVRGSLFLMLSASALLVRIGALMLLKALVFTAPGQRLVPLILAIGVSFMFNFMVSRQLVFRRGPASGNGPAR